MYICTSTSLPPRPVVGNILGSLLPFRLLPFCLLPFRLLPFVHSTLHFQIEDKTFNTVDLEIFVLGEVVVDKAGVGELGTHPAVYM